MFYLSRIMLLWLLATAAMAHDHQRPELNDWYKHLQSNSGDICCDATEPIVIDNWETHDGHYRIFVRGGWQDVPDSAVVHVPNLAGRALVWQGYPKNEKGPIVIRCFLPAAMA